MIDNIIKLKKEECYGCRSCEQVCPKKCISIKPDEEGFLYPVLDEKLCVNCGLCTKHCPAISKNTQNKTISFFGAYLKDETSIMQSSSGGLFAGIAEYVIKNGGIVFGCAFDEQLKANHIKAETIEELELLKKSKYVTSNTLNTYSEVSRILKNEPSRLVLYTGCPCQIQGLYAFLATKPDNLFTIDLVCHGVPSQTLFDKYVEWLEKKNNGKIVYYGFRDKDIGGWSCNGKAIFKYKNKTKIKEINCAIDPYYSSFMRGETYRLSCYNCSFANLNNRPADITIGDFWGIELIHPKFLSKKGNSCCIINTEKGMNFFRQVSDKFECIETTAEKITRMNRNLIQPTAKPNVRDSIYKGISSISVDKFIPRLYAPIHKRIIRYIISKIPFGIKTQIKKIVHKKHN